MSEHTPHVIQRHCDVAIIGGSAAGLAAALQLGRQRRSVIVVDAGEPRNAPAAHMHGYLAHEGLAPAELTALGREEVRSYGGEVLAGRATNVVKRDDGQFVVEVVGGHTLVARRVLVATGLIDELPDIEGVAEHWGRDVIHCPFCHGFEVRDLRIVQIVTHPMALHPTALFRRLSTRLTVLLHDGVAIDSEQIGALESAGVVIVRGIATRVVAGDDGRLVGVDLATGERIEADAVAIGPRFRVRADVVAGLGLEPAAHPSGLGDFIPSDETGATAVAGIYAAGNVTDPSHQVLHAAAHGSRVGAMIAMALAQDDVRSASDPSANRADWDQRYSGDQLWSGRPNGSLVHEIAGRPVGRALDVGAGEGGDAVWLAEQGWTVTASEISQNALDRIAAAASARGVHITGARIDANSLDAFAPASFELVTAHYASIPRTPDGRAVRNLLRAVAPGGLLLVVGHDLEPMRAPVDTRHHTRIFDPDAFVRVDDFADALSGAPEWDIEVCETRPRPAGAASTHHVDDVVLRARRRVE